VIDWTNARGGEPPLDVALTWLILATSGPTDPAGRLLVRAFLAAFLAGFDRLETRAALPHAAEHRLADPNLRPDEHDAIRRLLAAQGLTGRAAG